MQTFGYIAGCLLLLCILWFILKVFLGVVLPLEVTGRAYLKQLLKRMGLTAFVPPACVEECAAEAAKFSRQMARFSGDPNSGRKELVTQVELWAAMFQLWILGPERFDAPERQIYRDLFSRYAIPRQKVGRMLSNASAERSREQ